MSATSAATSAATSGTLTDTSSPVLSAAPTQAIFVHPYTTVNVKAHVPVTLDMKSANYSKWASFFTALCGKFSLRRHIDGTAAQPNNPDWDVAECCVRSWIFGTVDDSVLDLAITDENQTARQLWVAIEALFRTNTASRAVFLLEEFHTLKQGDSTIDEYSQRLKSKAAALRQVGNPITDSQLVLSLLRGLNPRFDSTADDIANATVLPPFTRAHELLSLKELRLANDAKNTAATALVASTTACCTSPSCRSSFAGVATGGSSKGGDSGGSGAPKQKGGKGGGKGRRSGGQGGKGNGGPQTGAQGAPQGGQYRPMGPWFCFNPYAPQGPSGQQAGGFWQGGQGGWTSGHGGWQGGQGGRIPGLLGANPQAHTAFAPAQVSTPQMWDQAGLIAALNQMALQNSNSWVMDSGATSHMHSSDGILLSRHPPLIPSSLWAMVRPSRFPVMAAHTYPPTHQIFLFIMFLLSLP